MQDGRHCGSFEHIHAHCKSYHLQTGFFFLTSSCNEIAIALCMREYNLYVLSGIAGTIQ